MSFAKYLRRAGPVLVILFSVFLSQGISNEDGALVRSAVHIRIVATNPVTDGTGQVILDPDSMPGNSIVLVHRDTDFVVHVRGPIAPIIHEEAVTLSARILLPTGMPANTQAKIPFRWSQAAGNSYRLESLVDLPKSADLGTPPFNDPQVTEFTRMRVVVEVDGTEVTFTVMSEGRYVNAPVCPNALYFAMGKDGLGVVDLDGNGFTTNDPSFSRQALVTSQLYYNKYGNAGMGLGNNYAYGAKATTPPGGGPPSYVGLGSSTPMPGVNEGSSGIDEVVRDSNGNAQLFPDPDSGFTVTDVEVGDFLDTLFFDEGNLWAKGDYRWSVIDQVSYGKYPNNLIATPPTPNPPPLTLPIGMQPIHVIRDAWEFSDKGVFVLMGKEVFTIDLATMVNLTASLTGFIHLNPAQLAGTPVDVPFPPNPSLWGGKIMNFMNFGPVAESSSIGFATAYGSRQQIGNFLFAADRENDVVRVLNSNTMEIIATLTDVITPDSLAVTSDLTKLYVSNYNAQSVSIFDVNPRKDAFLSLISRVTVGKEPMGICIQPDGEDVFVCNFGGDSISIIDQASNTVRKTLSAHLSKPWDMVVGPRQSDFGFKTGLYHGYISNFGGDNVLVYESGPQGAGQDDILGPVPLGTHLPIEIPRGLCWDPDRLPSGELSGGCYVAHKSGAYAMVSRIRHVAHLPKDEFAITDQWGGPANPLSGVVATDVALIDYNREAWENENWVGSSYVTNLGDIGSNPSPDLPINNKHPVRVLSAGVVPTTLPDRLFISFQYTPVIDVLNPGSGDLLKTITGLPAGAAVLKSYFK